MLLAHADNSKTIAHTAAMLVEIRSKISPYSQATRLSVLRAFGVGTANGRSRTSDTRGRRKAYSA